MKGAAQGPFLEIDRRGWSVVEGRGNSHLDGEDQLPGV
ncbi:Hypothetical protein PFREUD_23850 [Propionibacterium freudenreichii subsp. shermanii CIRM-BIA1]|uniref:Uncharacterized protein n=1 Tax=Propionibacterium freudenreichii subsp. shermanii (strain ATCC 9614 / DSM 4902 / CIP 103027 / NCIMB 8099 / CIRM-BIA1) TaxID=754252 RepID=D7GH90_PROFC|nr:Hypothetical protein PFREUD_23850 [Propionibacterium freudenreichii subsp. shermanii CIRM-BIA1]